MSTAVPIVWQILDNADERVGFAQLVDDRYLVRRLDQQWLRADFDTLDAAIAAIEAATDLDPSRPRRWRNADAEQGERDRP